jgi:glycosyltransferase involved in cell wall biosynthesis
MKTKVSIITNIPTPYRDAQFQILKGYYPNLKIFFTGDHRENRKWSTKTQEHYFSLPRLLYFGKYGSLNRGLLKLTLKSDVLIIGGYEQPTYILLAIISKLMKKPTILLYDGIAPSKLQNKKNMVFYIKYFVIKLFDYYWVNGSISQDYLQKKFDCPPNRIFNQYLTVDDKYFKENIEHKYIVRNKLRQLLKINSDVNLILFSGRNIPRKGLKDLINAIKILNKQYPKKSFHLMLIGDNFSSDAKLIADLKASNIHYYLSNFIEQDSLYKYYFASDVLVLPSIDEPWGLVVNEAIFSEIPVVVSTDVGCVQDLVIEGQNGYIFSALNCMSLANSINKSLKLSPKLVQQASVLLKKKWNLNNSCRELTKIISKASDK